ncbi:MAG: glycosyltransferase [Limisphaerales bacterium]
MMATAQGTPRVSVDGKFFRLGREKFFVRGVTYGPFAPNAAGQPWASPEQTAADFAQLRQLGANVVRVYHVPARWLLDLAHQHGLKLLVDVPWNKHLCFLDDPAETEAAREAVRRAVRDCAGHPAVFAFSLANEIPPDVVRWHGANAVAAFLDELAGLAKSLDPQCLCTYANFPPTEFLRPQNLDFTTFNVYLHDPRRFENYLARLQMIADTKPLLLGEFGVDSLREGEARQAEILGWAVEGAFRAGLAGAVVFSFTDDWWRGGQAVTDWQMGLTTVNREPKPAFAVVREKFAAAPRFPLARYPKVSVVVASYNSERTLRACLESLERLHYPDYEVILVDDGSTDATAQLVFQGRTEPGPAGGTFPMFSDKPGQLAAFPHLRYFRHAKNEGLSVARNTGIAAATGEIIAFTDADCRADEDWLYYLVGALLSREFGAVGGPNFLPPEDSAVAAAVMVSPGGPAHVMLDDRQAEHIPGCNMAFWRDALAAINGFDPIFKRAGDDVDVCWRLEQAGYKIGFSPAALVWHYRRATVGAYLKQQAGYGEAEAMLIRKHPEYFNSFGGSLWRGRIYTASRLGVLLNPPIIYRGAFGSGWFQTLYTAPPASTLMLATSLEYHALILLPLWLLAVVFPWLLGVAVVATLIPLVLCAVAGAQSVVPPDKHRWWTRPLIGILYFLQPIVRGWARYAERLSPAAAPAPRPSLESEALARGRQPLTEVCYWSERPLDRVAFVTGLIERLDATGWPNKADIGWSEFDVELFGNRWSSVQLTTATEEHPQGRHLLRIRLRPRWSLETRVGLATLLGGLLLVLGLLWTGTPWRWLLLLVLLPSAWLLRRQARALQAMTVVFLDETAKQWGLVKLESNPAPPSAVPASKDTQPVKRTVPPVVVPSAGEVAR